MECAEGYVGLGKHLWGEGPGSPLVRGTDALRRQPSCGGGGLQQGCLAAVSGKDTLVSVCSHFCAPIARDLLQHISLPTFTSTISHLHSLTAPSCCCVGATYWSDRGRQVAWDKGRPQLYAWGWLSGGAPSSMWRERVGWLLPFASPAALFSCWLLIALLCLVPSLHRSLSSRDALLVLLKKHKAFQTEHGQISVKIIHFWCGWSTFGCCGYCGDCSFRVQMLQSRGKSVLSVNVFGFEFM